MNIETIRIFCDVVQHRSFSRGAASNDVSQSAATQSVHRVERHFGSQLIDRTDALFSPYLYQGQTGGAERINMLRKQHRLRSYPHLSNSIPGRSGRG